MIRAEGYVKPVETKEEEEEEEEEAVFIRGVHK